MTPFLSTNSPRPEGSDASGIPFPEGSEESALWEAWLMELLECPVTLRFTRNRSTMLSWRKDKAGGFRVGLHHMFSTASEDLWVALAHYLVHEDLQSGAMLDAFIAENKDRYTRPVGPTNPVGRHHDLQKIFDDLNARFFHNRCDVQLTWGRTTGGRARKSIQLGCFVPGDRLIRVHPCLDQAFVPDYYVAWVLFHEMLHEVFGVEEVQGRRRVHPPEFVALEQSFPDYERCRKWESANLSRLLKYRARAKRARG